MSQRKCLETSSFSVERALGRYRRGDEGALGDLMRELSPAMTAVARRYLTAQCDAEDAMQDAWMSFVRAQHTIVHPERAGGWLCVTAARAALSIALRQNRCEPIDDEQLGRLACAWSDELEGIDDARRRRLVRRAIGRLSDRDQQLIDLLIGDDELSYAVISARTGCAVGGIGPTRQRIIAKLGRDGGIRQLAQERSA